MCRAAGVLGNVSGQRFRPALSATARSAIECGVDPARTQISYKIILHCIEILSSFVYVTSAILDLAVASLYRKPRCSSASYTPLTKMASFTSPPPSLEPAAAARFVAPPGCAPHLRQAYEKAVNAHPLAWRREPVSGEVFKDLAEAERRLRCYSLAAGFDLVRGSGGTRAVPGSSFLCLYHGQETRNFRGLEESVMRDDKGNIVSRRQLESTSVRQRACP